MDDVFPQRLKSARVMAGLSMQQLALRMGKRVSKQAISKYEQGAMRPDSTVLIALAQALAVKPGYFFRPFRWKAEPLGFRKHSKLSQKEIRAIEEKAKDELERYIELEELLGIWKGFENPVNQIIVRDFYDVEQAALQVRHAWDLGLNPLANVFEMLEGKGVKIIQAEVDGHFDGLSSIVNGVPVIVINSIADILRRRFTLLHELGHVLLQVPQNIDNRKLEAFCNTFAGAMLVPKPVMLSELGKRRKMLTLNELIELKGYYGVSVQALAYRARQLDIVGEQWSTSFWRYIKSKPQRREEIGMGTYQGREQSERFKQLLFRAVAEEIISLNKAAELLNCDVGTIREQLSLV